ncbi:MAG: SnoaL-like polyketide cyclase [Nitrososphaeraceae archaeon]|jgi:predicted ester cyclase|nr:SnoaL-like polyketide cyclase [Nitrososphaeraceae archaeon]MCD6036233.1 SnoaL-like polyketide cyclase [Nitrososphaeraceae archaeon]MDF2768854.1 SnoaL-like polyketide cyclase [Nitrososphaeraceae archaeon]
MSTFESLGPIAATMSGGLAIILTTWNATHQGEYLGIPPTGKQITHR